MQALCLPGPSTSRGESWEETSGRGIFFANPAPAISFPNLKLILSMLPSSGEAFRGYARLGNRPEDLYVLVLSDEPSLIRGREVRLTLENLEARAPKEFPRGKPIAISCAGVSFADCAASLKVLQGLAFNEGVLVQIGLSER